MSRSEHSRDALKELVPVFGGSGLDRLDARRLDDAWLTRQMRSPVSRFVVVRDDLALVALNSHRHLALLNKDDVAGLLDAGAPGCLLGRRGANIWFGIDASGHGALGDALVVEEKRGFNDLRSIAIAIGDPAKDQGQCAALAQAKVVFDWHRRHGFCANCGAETEMHRAGYMRACTNEECGHQHFPRTDPVVIMLVTSGDKCLLARQSHFPAGMYSALAGFMEPAETIEEAVRREVMEEAGLPVGEVSYVGSQPWPFPSSLMIGCQALALAEDVRLNDGELEDWFWADRARVRQALQGADGPGFQVPPRMAIAHELMRAWAL